MQNKFSAYLILSFLMAALLAARQTPQTWVTYTPPSGKFTALFPTEPKADHQTTNDGGLITEVYTYLSSEKGIFFVNYMHLNPNATLSAYAALKTAQDGLLQTGGAKLLTSTRTDYVRGPNDRLPMLEFTGETDTTFIKGSAILDTDHIYTLATLCPKGQDCSAAVTKFLSSFKLNPATQQTNDTWVKFTSSEGKFSALFPHEPIPDRKTINTEGQTIQVNNFIVTVNDMVIGVTYTDYDPNSIYPVESGMKAEQDTLMNGFHATLLTSTRTEFPRGSNEKLPSLKFSGASNDRDLNGVVIVDVRRVYVVASICPKTKDCSAASEKFFSSFRLTPKN
ncbi:MAG: hypothetical protein WAM91_10990 [Candidatus Acidiferrales bacterium]